MSNIHNSMSLHNTTMSSAVSCTNTFEQLDAIVLDLYNCLSELFVLYSHTSGSHPESPIRIIGSIYTQATVYHAMIQSRPSLFTNEHNEDEYIRLKKWVACDARMRYFLSAIDARVLYKVPSVNDRASSLIHLGTTLLSVLRSIIPFDNHTHTILLKVYGRLPIIPNTLCTTIE